MTNNSQKGFAVPMIIAMVAVVLIVGGVAYYSSRSQGQADKMAEEKAMMEKMAMKQKEEVAMMEKKEMEVVLNAENTSNQNGKATFSDVNGKTKVTITIASGAATVPQPAHIHVGACPNPGAVKYPLTNVVDGKSETMLEVSLSQLTGELPLAVNVHKSGTEAKTYVSCGDIVAEMMMDKEGA